MIFTSWQAFRLAFSNGEPVDALGVPGWPVASMRAGGFDGGIAMDTSASPYVLTCNAEASDPVQGVDRFDWYVSAGSADGGVLVVERHDPTVTTQNSGSIEISLTPAAAVEYPEPFDVSTIPVLWFAVDVYVRRRSDGAIQRLDVAAYLAALFGDRTDVG